MRHIMVMNAKGGCGKSTIATNIASHFATEGYSVALADFDPQQSSMDWLSVRPETCPTISAVAAYDEGLTHVPRNADVVVIDAPARTHRTELTALVRQAMRNELWGKARSYLESSIAIRADPEAYHIYGRLLEQLGEREDAAEAFRSGLLLATDQESLRLPILKPSDDGDDAGEQAER